MTSQEQSRCNTPSEPQRTTSPTIPREYADTVKSTAKQLVNIKKIVVAGISLSYHVPADYKYRTKCISGLNTPQDTIYTEYINMIQIHELIYDFIGSYIAIMTMGQIVITYNTLTTFVFISNLINKI